jgi:type IV secretory pathway TraG/TraD family ATPase VirD4
MYVDEFQNFITKEFEQILSEARKYKIGLIIAHQYIDQLINQKTKDESVQKAVFGNAGTFVTFRV